MRNIVPINTYTCEDCGESFYCPHEAQVWRCWDCELKDAAFKRRLWTCVLILIPAVSILVLSYVFEAIQ